MKSWRIFCIETAKMIPSDTEAQNRNRTFASHELHPDQSVYPWVTPSAPARVSNTLPKNGPL